MATRRGVEPTPPQPQGRSKKQQNVFAFKGYVRCDFDEGARTAVKDWAKAQTHAKMLPVLLGYAEQGYKVSIGWAANGFSASMSDVDATEEHRGYVLSAFGKHAESAVLGLIYKHEVILEHDWSRASQEEVEYR